jgi:hypothetical protein
VLGGSAYLSGRGGANYQDPSKFRDASIELRYTAFANRSYPQVGCAEFVPGLSVVDALFNIGAQSVSEMIASAAEPTCE